MVSYQTLVDLAFQVADEKGAEYEGIQEGGAFLSEIATYWQANKQELRGLTESQARNRLNQVIEP